jgi:ADP-ribose pyrophosphatase YjhB (NUDIX family)
MSFDWLHIAKELQALAQAGIEFSENKYDLERYQQIREISVRIMHNYTDTPVEKIRDLFAFEKGYQTPKVDVRGVVFREGKILMVRETIDGMWTLPGGWADVGLSPFENTAKEVREEAGIEVEPVRLLAVFDKVKHPHTPDIYHIYKMFILCKDSGQVLKKGMETSDVGWFGRNEIPSALSLPRITISQIETMFDYFDNPSRDVTCD